jgi:hypothetical protein
MPFDFIAVASKLVVHSSSSPLMGGSIVIDPVVTEGPAMDSLTDKLLC